MNSHVNVQVSLQVFLTEGMTDDCFSARLPQWVKTRGFMMHGHPSLLINLHTTLIN